MIRNPFSTSQKQILAKFVDFPTPFTPQKVIVYGRFWLLACNTSRKISTRLRGVRICTRDSSIPLKTAYLKNCKKKFKRIRKKNL